MEERLSAYVSPVLATLLELAKTVTDKPISDIIVDVDSIDHDIESSVEQDALRV